MVKKSWEKKVDNKGFTLVELIVVLVILAILAAILVPALLGYIDRAKGSQILLNAKAALTAAQAEASNAYGTSKETSKTALTAKTADIAKTADVSGKFYFVTGGNNKASDKAHAAWTVTYFAYTDEASPTDDSPAVYFDYSTKSWVENSNWKDAKTAVDNGGKTADSSITVSDAAAFGNGIGN